MGRRLLPGVLLLMMLLAGCMENLFMQWDMVELPSADEMNTKASSDPEGFLEDVNEYLAMHEDTINEKNAPEVITALQIVYAAPGISGETKAEAALLIGEISLEEDKNAGIFINSVGNALDDLQNMQDGADVSAVIQALVPPEVKTDPVLFGSMIDTLLSSSDGYLDFGMQLQNDNITDPDQILYLDGGDIGSTVQRTAITTAVKAVLDALDGAVDGSIDDPETQKTILFNLVNGEAWPTTGVGDPTVIFGDSPPPAYEGLDDVLGLMGLDLSGGDQG